jgi:Rad3-related DNA helicase
VLDKRIVTKFYGRAFLESLPAARLVRGPQRGVLLALDQFFHGESNPEDTT